MATHWGEGAARLLFFCPIAYASACRIHTVSPLLCDVFGVKEASVIDGMRRALRTGAITAGLGTGAMAAGAGGMHAPHAQDIASTVTRAPKPVLPGTDYRLGNTVEQLNGRHPAAYRENSTVLNPTALESWVGGPFKNSPVDQLNRASGILRQLPAHPMSSSGVTWHEGPSSLNDQFGLGYRKPKL